MSDLKASTFDFYAAATGVTTPEDTVAIYLDVETAYQLEKINKALNSSAAYRNSTETQEEFETRIEKLENEKESLQKKLESDKITVTLKGILQQRVDSILADIESEFGKDNDSKERMIRTNAALLAAHIVKIEDASGAVDNSQWDTDRVEQLYHLLPLESVSRLTKAVEDLSLRTDYFENAEINSDF